MVPLKASQVRRTRFVRCEDVEASLERSELALLPVLLCQGTFGGVPAEVARRAFLPAPAGRWRVRLALGCWPGSRNTTCRPCPAAARPPPRRGGLPRPGCAGTSATPARGRRWAGPRLARWRGNGGGPRPSPRGRGIAEPRPFAAPSSRSSQGRGACGEGAATARPARRSGSGRGCPGWTTPGTVAGR